MPSRSLVLALSGLLLACSTVKHSQTAPDWNTVGAQQVKRLIVVTSPLPEGNENVGKLWSRIARRYVNQKREFLAKEEAATATLEGAKSLCKEGIEGVLHLQPTVARKGNGVEESVKAVLVACPNGQEQWSAEAAGSWDSKDSLLEQTTKEYVEDLGPDVEPYVAPAFHLLKATLDTLPNPTLNEQDKDEKIELID